MKQPQYDQYGMTPLHWAAKEGEKEEIDSLLQDGCDKNWRIQKTEVTPFGECKVGDTPLIVAVRYGHSEVVAMLLTKWEVDTESQDSEGNTALHIAVAKGNIENTKALLNAKAKTQIKNQQGVKPLMMFPFKEEGYSEDWMSDYITWLLENYHHMVPLQLEAAALHSFVYQGKIKEVEAILQRIEEFVNVKSTFFKRGIPNRFFLCFDGSERFLALLGDSLKDPLRKVTRTIPFFSPWNNEHYFALLSNNFAVTPLHIAATLPSSDTLDLLLRYGADVNATNGFGETPLHYAARFGRNVNASKLVLNHQPTGDTLNRKNNTTGNTALHVAIINADRKYAYHQGRIFGYKPAPIPEENYLETVRVLVEAGACRDEMNSRFRTPMVEAMSRYYYKNKLYFDKLSEILTSKPSVMLAPAPVFAPAFSAHQAAITTPLVLEVAEILKKKDVMDYYRCVIL